MAAGNYGGRISLLTCRKQNFKRLSPGSLTCTHTYARTHRHTTPLCVCLLSLPPALTPHTLHITVNFIRTALACVCVGACACACVHVPQRPTHWSVSMTSAASICGPHLSSAPTIPLRPDGSDNDKQRRRLHFIKTSHYY